MSRNNRDGFTLIELLVVISIISVVISVLLPALSSARRAALEVRCLSQLRQMGIVAAAYATDAKGLVPSLIINPEDNGAAPALVRYAEMTAEVARCPGLPAPATPSVPLRYLTYGTLGLDRTWVRPVSDHYKSFVHQGYAWSMIDTESLEHPGSYAYLFDSVAVNLPGGLEQRARFLLDNSTHGFHLRHGENKAQLLFLDGRAAGADTAEIRRAVQGISRGTVIVNTISRDGLSDRVTLPGTAP